MRGLIVLALLFASISLIAATAPLFCADAEDVVPGEYIVVLHENATVQIRDYHVSQVSSKFNDEERIKNVFNIGSLIGYSAVLSKDTLAKMLEEPAVRYVEANQRVSINLDTTITQTGAPWGISRISQEKLPLGSTYTYWASAGAEVLSYVIDTGIYAENTDFGGRVDPIRANLVTGEDDKDGNGHGTHVAGTIGGTKYGVAKKTTLVSVKVLGAGGSGTWDGVIKGIEWVANDYRARKVRKGAVANMSLGGGLSPTVDTAVNNAITMAGVNFAIAAGNSNANACQYSPANVPLAITVGATTNTDARASYSNIGTCLDVFAPGSNIESTWIGSPSAINTISGTSMAAPHVAGAVAVYISHLFANGETIEPTPVDVVEDFIQAYSIKDVVIGPGTGSPNAFLFSPYIDK